MKRKLFSRKWQYILISTAVLILLLAIFLVPNATHQPATAQTPSATAPRNITAMMDDNNSLIFHIHGTVSAPGKVMVKYWSANAGPFTTQPVATSGNAFSLEVMRLKPSTQYNYQVFLVPSSNNPVSQYQGTFITGPLPSALQSARIQLIQGTPTTDLILLDYNCTGFNGIVAIDRDDQIVWYYQNDNQVFTLAQEVNHNLVFNEIGLVVGYAMKEITPDGGIVHSINDTLQNGEVSKPNGRWHHEMLLQPGNKVWTMGAEIRPVIINGKNTLQTGDTIEEWDISKGTVTRLVSTFDLLDPVADRAVDSDTTGGFFWLGSQNQYVGVAEDWNHANSLEVLPDGKILMSLRHLNQVIAIKPDFSGVAWTLGGVGSSFTFPNPSDQFYHQHYVKMLPNGNLLLFDNGNLRPQDQGGQYSRAMELKLDFNTMQASKVWEYRSKPDLYAPAVGSAIRLINGNTLVDFGFVDVNVPAIFTLAEVDPSGNPVAVTQIRSPGKNTQYRAIPVDSLNGETKE